MNYEQLLHVQQQHHALLLQEKDAEIRHLQARLDFLESEAPHRDRRVEEALRTKEEEAAVMMAAKHKELELLAGLLQLREQQIDDFNRLCEEQHRELSELREAPGFPSLADAQRRPPALDSPAGSVASNRSSRHPTRGASSDNGQLFKEVQKLRLRMEDLEAAVSEQGDRNVGLARNLEARSKQAGALEAELRRLREAGNTVFLSEEVPHGLLAHGHRPTNSREVAHVDHDPRSYFVRPEAFAPHGHRGREAGQVTPSFSCPQAAPVESQHSWSPGPSQEFWDAEQRAEPVTAAAPGRDFSGHRETALLDGPSFGSCHALDGHTDVRKAGSLDSPDPAAGVQSKELLQEMRRLRMQMLELERVAGSCGGDGQPHQAVPRRAEVLSPCGRGQVSPDQPAPSGRALAAEHFKEPIASKAFPGDASWISATKGAATTTTLDTEPLAAAVSGTGRLAAFSARSEELGLLPEFAGWEYKAHLSGDPIDAAVAALVNQPGGRYRGWRALLCRLEQGVYLCGTSRVQLRADVAQDLIEASSNGGVTWTDIAMLLRGSEAGQRPVP